jgi:hypothetical protein
MQEKEKVYILTNESMPGYIKIGLTKGPIERRVSELSRKTSVPLPFEVYYAAVVDNAAREENWLHSIFGDRRVRDGKEFFMMNPEYAALALKRVALEEVLIETPFTPEQEAEVKEAKERRSKFHFAHFGIPVGSLLTFTRDPRIIATVMEKDKIMIDGKTGSMSTFARDLLGYKRIPQGTLYFKFEDEILDDRRKRLESEN